MSEPKQPTENADVPPDLTPKEQAEQDQERVQGQLVVTDVTRTMQNVMDAIGFGSFGGTSGRTSFEGHELNAMIDLIENSSPEHLEEAGQALLKARTSLNDAAKELGDFIGQVDWEGESGTAFRDWGNGLVSHAYKLGEYAQTAGTQITVAGTGLASVRSSLPPRDTRLVRKSPDEIESPARIEGNPEYAAAVKVEKDRQEAINQANRLASYYAVSEETLAAQEPPRFEKKLDVAMPRPRDRRVDDDSGDATGGSGGNTRGSIDAPERTETSADASTATDGQADFRAPRTIDPVQDGRTSTEINSVAAPPTQPAPGTPVSPVSNGPTVPGGPTLSVPPVFTNPVTSTSRALQTPTGAPRAVSASDTRTPRGSGPTNGGSFSGRTGNPVGRPPASVANPTSNGSGRVAGGPQSPAAGRYNNTGVNSPRAGRPTGIVGGTPQRAPSGPGGARGVPRGTVIGAGDAAGAARPSGRGVPGANGVVGSPRGGAMRQGAGAKGFTAGGSGLVRGAAARKNAREEDQDQGTPRPDYLTEDRETWEGGRRGAAPPVIE
ncbi:hypothetical protein AB0M42_13050 [Streptomyces sp. NPDC051784]|uniref:hypothetical protein n=1 Tax=Streptomyces sp. NPDC051784 TaxID=3155805 RepID=UPI003444DD63